MNIKELINGIVVIIDDEVNDEKTAIYKIRRQIMDSHFPVATYEDIPDIKDIKALSHAAFIILDWNFYQDSSLLEDSEERLMIPGLKEDKKEQLITFLKALLKEIFVPVFIFTTSHPDEVRDTLREVEVEVVDEDRKSGRVFVKQKDFDLSEEELFHTIESWMNDMPSVYALKVWEKTANEVKTNLFLEWQSLSPDWVPVIWNMMKIDSIDNAYEFGTFLTRNITNRMQMFEFEEDYIPNIQGDDKSHNEELWKIMEGERYQQYDKTQLPKQAYTGDLILYNGDYFLNIRAQCDISRPNKKDKEYNPELYLIKGSILNTKEVALRDIQLTENGELLFSNGTKKALKDMMEIYNNPKKLERFNKKFSDNRNFMVYYSSGELLEKKTEAIIACVDEGKIIKFSLRDFSIKKFDEMKEYRIGRILPPYINRVQAKFSQYIVREGVTPIPEELLVR